ncbi:MAG: LysM peptidoglycan-binding domain-containing protein [Myxococcaceae bacterium]|nr:LysM peptidoglycan-binding domain-containing protein [Myxococcaceae bacterium]
MRVSSYRIVRGDTLSTIARRHGTSVSALMQANPKIRDPNRIFAGDTLTLPGRGDGFRPANPQRPAVAPQPGLGPIDTSAAGRSGDAFGIARQFLGWNAGDLKVSNNAVGRAMHDWVPNNVNCANFVSGVLRAAGQLSAREHHNGVYGLMNTLDRNPGFRRVSLRDARPGDVVSMRTPGGQHVVLFAGWSNGRPQFIGSNNVNRDGSQRVTITGMNYPIMAVHQFQG